MSTRTRCQRPAGVPGQVRRGGLAAGSGHVRPPRKARMFRLAPPARVTCLACLACLICLAMALFPSPASAELKRVVYGFDREFPPYSYEREGEAVGFDVDLLRAVLRGRAEQVVTRPMNWETVLLELSGGGIHVATGMIKTKQRQLLYAFADEPTLELRAQLFTKNTLRVGNVTQLRGRKVAVKKGTLFQTILEGFGGLNIKTFDSDLDALKALNEDQVEVYGGAGKTAYYYLRRLNMPGISAVGTPISSTNVYFATNKDQVELLRALNMGMHEIWDSGEYLRIYRKWFVEELKPEEQRALVEAARQAAVNGYAPYSRAPSGAAVLGRTGRIYPGCTVENRDAPLSASALAVAVHMAVANAETEIRAVVTLSPDGRIVSPSAPDRGVVYEFGPETLVLTEPEPGKVVTRMIAELVPVSLVDLDRRQEPFATGKAEPVEAGGNLLLR